MASKGEGVLETFAAILSLVVDDLRRSYAPLQLPEGQTIEGWTRQAVLGMFGSLKLEPKADAKSESARAAPIEHMKVRIFTPQDAPVATLVGADSKASDVLAESYAEASAQLGIAVNELREERDLLRVRLDEVQRALELATEAPGETDVEARVRAILQVLVTGASASGATLLLYTGEAAQVLALPPLVADPLSRTIWGATHVESQRTLAEPLLAEADGSAELAQALRAGEPSFEAVAYVPLRSAERLLGLALLYFDANAAVPTRERLVHVGFLARVLSGPLEAMAAREATLAGDRQKVLSRASAAAVASLLTRLPPELARRQPVRLAEVLAPLRV
ncbi:MAG TPA: hypothetical protein VMV01_21305, partial [Planctomycetota bacterium]|nr:hypothetical protein [Planctomycetota bacterium]